MRVLVVSDRVGLLSSAQAGAALAAGWTGAEVTVTPAGESGAGFVRAAADAHRAHLETTRTDAGVLELATWRASSPSGVEAVVALTGSAGPAPGLPLDASSAPLGAALVDLLGRSEVRRCYLDLGGLDVHDGGAGLLGALGGVADRPLDRGVRGLQGVTAVDLGPARRLLGDLDLVGVVPSSERERLLLGLRGITSVRGRAAEEPPDRLLQTDAVLDHFAAGTAPEWTQARGSGACGGMGFAVLALGGRLDTGPALAVESLRGSWDLVVTGCSVFDFATRGGGVVAAAAALAGRALSPCVVLAGEVLIGGREMRTLGIEAAYAVSETPADRPSGGPVDAEDLQSLAGRVARSWRW